MKIEMPPQVEQALFRLRQAGYRAVAVGGCVRDMLRGAQPHDWDIASSALPEEVKAVFAGERVVETGLKHGTLMLILDHTPIEITTFRTDGDYGDGRRPDAVRLGSTLEEDLSRRDFTINALCIDQEEQIIDLFDGRGDLSRGIIRCIGDADRRFEEDALRLLRALRFAAAFGFTIEENTAKSIRRNLHRLRLLSAERVIAELQGLLVAPDVERVLLEYSEVMFALMPPLQALAGMVQSPQYHCFDGYRHTARAVAEAPPVFLLRFTMLLHDIGKPLCDDQEKQFYGHDKAGAELANLLLHDLRCKTELRHQIVQLIRLHQLPLPFERAALRRLVAKHGEALLRDLAAVQRADAAAHTIDYATRKLADLDRFEAAFEALLAECPALTQRELAMNGDDLLALGVPKGKMIGQMLQALLDEVIAERLPNDREALLSAAKSRLQENI